MLTVRVVEYVPTSAFDGTVNCVLNVIVDCPIPEFAPALKIFPEVVGIIPVAMLFAGPTPLTLLTETPLIEWLAAGMVLTPEVRVPIWAWRFQPAPVPVASETETEKEEVRVRTSPVRPPE